MPRHSKQLFCRPSGMTSDVSPWHPMYIWHTIDIGVIRHWNDINAIMSRIPISSFFLLELIAINNIYFCQLMWCWNNISQIKKKTLWLAVISYMHKIEILFENIRCATAFLKNNICTYICIPFLFFTAATYFFSFSPYNISGAFFWYDSMNNVMM